MLENCLVSDSFDSNCIQCVDGYSFNGKECVLENCATVRNGHCIKCEKGYEQVKGKCVDS